MDDAVSNALHARTHAPEGLAKMLLVSVAVHVILMTLATLAPASFWRRPVDARSTTVMIDLGPGAGPHTGGLTPMGARPVQRAVSNPPPVSSVRPTPAQPTSMQPTPVQPPSARPTPTQPSAARTPESAGAVVAPGAPAATASQSTGAGLSTPSGAGAGVQVKVGDFCCPDYVATMAQRIHQNWTPGRGAAGVTTMQLTIQRDGAITDVQLVRSSGNQMLDFLARRALLAVRQLPPLPDAYTNPSLIVSLEFQYQR
jgi:TonB family protein